MKIQPFGKFVVHKRTTLSGDIEVTIRTSDDASIAKVNPYAEVMSGSALSSLLASSPVLLSLLKECAQVILSEVPKNKSGVRELLDSIDRVTKEIEG